MADTDVFGILSLLLAAGGAAYLLRARFLARAELEASEAEEEEMQLAELGAPARSEDGRTAATIPPKLRPPSIPPNPPGASSHPDRWYRDDLAEAAKQKEDDAKAHTTKKLAAQVGATPNGPSVGK